MAAQAPATALLGSAEHRDQPTGATRRRTAALLPRQAAQHRVELLHRRRLLDRRGALGVLVEGEVALAGLLRELLDGGSAGLLHRLSPRFGGAIGLDLVHRLTSSVG